MLVFFFLLYFQVFAKRNNKLFMQSLSFLNFDVEWLVVQSTWKWIFHVTHIISLRSTWLLHVARWVQLSIEDDETSYSFYLLNSKFINAWVCKLSQLSIRLIKYLSWTLFFFLAGVEPLNNNATINNVLFFCHHKYLRSSNRKVSL